MSELVFETRQVQLRCYAEEDDGLSWFICGTSGEYDVPWFDSVGDLLKFVDQIRVQFGVGA